MWNFGIRSEEKGKISAGVVVMKFEVPKVLLEVNLVSTAVRLFLALLCGGILGSERGRKRRPAGLRTYMLVCMGAALVMITNQYIETQYSGTDVSRMGAQVISGIGFLGAGTIIVTGRNRVKGLTTAAGLWAAACVGLSIGIGFYWGAIIGCIAIFVIMSVLYKLDDWMQSSTRTISLYLEFEHMADVGKFIRFSRERGYRVSDLEMTRTKGVDDLDIGVLCNLRLQKKTPHAEIIQMLSEMEMIRYVEEM